MADKELKSNVIVEGTWYGPDYPQNKVTAEVLDQIDNPAAFADTTSPVDLRMRVDDGLEPVVDADEKPTRRSATK